MGLEKENILTWLGDKQKRSNGNFKVRSINTTTVVTPMEKHLGPGNCFELERSVKSIISQGKRRIAINLKHVRSADLAGLGVLVACLRAVREEDGDLSLLCVQQTVKGFLEFIGLDKVFNICEDAPGNLMDFTPGRQPLKVELTSALI